MNRDKYKRYWYPGVMDAIKNYERIGASPRENEIKQAIKSTIDEMRAEDEGSELKDGEATIKIVTLSLIKHTHTLEGAAMTIPGLSIRKARRLRSGFIYRVASKIGY